MVNFDLKKGQIIGYKPKATKHWLVALIKLGGAQRFTHVMQYVGNNKVVEAGWPLVREREYYSTWLNDKEFEVIEIEDSTEEEIDRVIETIYSYVGVRYDWWHYPFLFLDTWFGRIRWVKKLLDMLKKIDDFAFMNCSEVIARAWRANGHDLCEEKVDDFTKPDHIMYTKCRKTVYPKW